jgi:hypothetical protein
MKVHRYPARPVQRRAGRIGLRTAVLAGLALLCLWAIYALSGAPVATKSRPVKTQAERPAPRAPEILHEDKGGIQILERVQVQALPAIEVQPLFEAGLRLTFDETTKLRFVARDRASGKPESSAVMTAALLHGTNPPVALKVEEVDDGVFEVPVTPHGPGRFDVVLSANGVQVGSQRVGVVGTAGGAPGVDDFLDFTGDMRAGRSRPGGRGRTR